MTHVICRHFTIKLTTFFYPPNFIQVLVFVIVFLGISNNSMTISAMRDIINGGQLPAFNGKNVSITGLITDVAAGGSAFTMRAADNVVVNIILNSKPMHPPEGYVEVHGVVRDNNIHAQDYIIFENKEFDATNHNKLCQLLYVVPNLWNTS